MNIFIYLTIISVIVFVIVFCFYPLPLTFKNKSKVKNLGLKHYTTSEYAAQIVNSRKFKAVNSGFAFFYINEEIPQNVMDYNMRTHQGEPRDKVVVVQNLSEPQIKSLKFWRDDLAISHKGDFVLSVENNVTVTDV